MTPDAAILIASMNGAQTTAPTYATKGSAAFDLHAYLKGQGGVLTLQPGERAMISVGFVMAIAEGFWGRISPRSGLAVKHGVDVLAGVIDSDYRGEVHAVLVNHGKEPFIIHNGDRIAQMVISPVAQLPIHIVEHDQLGDTERGAGGFGSTGVAAVA